jgi:hypothetical protein
MAAAAHTPGGYDGVPQSVGKEFNQADKGTGIRKATGGVVEHPDHFVVPHESGGHFIVAKHGLEPHTHRFLQSLCEGGGIGMGDGGEVEEGSGTPNLQAGGDIMGNPTGSMAGDEPHFDNGGMVIATPAPGGTGMFQQRSANPNARKFAGGGDSSIDQLNQLPDPNFDSTSDPDANARPTGVGELKREDEKHLAPKGMQQGQWDAARQAMEANGLSPDDAHKAGFDASAPPTSSGDIVATDKGIFGDATKQDADGTMGQPESTQPQGDPFGSISVPKTRVSPLEGESEDARAAREQAEADTRASAAATEESNNQRNAVLKEQQAHEEASHAVYKATQDGLTKKMDDLNQDILHTKIDPDHYWQKKGVAGRINATLGLLLSGFGSGLARNGTPNLALKVIQDNINRDIDAQKEDLGTKKGVLAEYHRQFGDSQIAEQAARLHANVLVTSQLQVIANNSTSQQAKIRADQLVQLSKMQSAQQITNIANLNKQRYDNAYNTDAHNRFELALTTAKAKAEGQAAGARPREMQGKTIGNLQATMTDLDDHLKLLDNSTQGPILGGLQLHNPYAENTQTAAANAKAITEKLASALGGGVASDARIHQVMALVPGPEVPPGTARKMIAQAKLLLKTSLDEYRAQQGGVGFRVGPGPVR